MIICHCLPLFNIMGNQLCPNSTKDLIQGFRELQKGQTQYHPYFKCCVNSQTVESQQYLSFLKIHDSKYRQNPHSTFENSKIESVSMVKEQNNVQDELVKQKIVQKHLPQQDQVKKVVDLVLANGWKYKGEAVRSIPEGKGEEFGPKGEYYSGSFSKGKKQGYGQYKFANGLVYKGNFKDNFMWGHGTFEFLNGDSFQGEFVKNVREGKGKYIMHQPNIDQLLYFEGEYKNDVKNGPGVMKYVDYEVRGNWKDGHYDYSFQSEYSQRG